MATAVNHDERRDFSRIALHRPAALDLRGAIVHCDLLDISLRGALVRVPEAFKGAAGDPCAFAVALDSGETVIRMRGVLAHRAADAAGIRCDEIDLESASHLRRLVELNLGDDRLLHRELVALVAR
jgi:hypothetical protein